ncbi:MAG: hypothetical protein NWF10_01895 [Candidatus Bathyarchaeota archaeon]|nr:hypothetical protein [Candidatus Bathyarchaeota archaeon]
MSMNSENDSMGTFDTDSKFVKILLVLTAVFLIFAGPTYVSYLLSEVFNLNYLAAVTVGFSLFLVGLFLIYFLVKRKIIV